MFELMQAALSIMAIVTAFIFTFIVHICTIMWTVWCMEDCKIMNKSIDIKS